MASGVYSNYNPYGKNLARQKQRRFFIKILSLILIILIFSVVLIYIAFYSHMMRIEAININGLETVKPEEILATINPLINQEIFGILKLKPQLNIYLFDGEYIKDKIYRDFIIIKEIEIIKEFPHGLAINIEERKPLGTWCLKNNCYYFDEFGLIWGEAIRSSGSLLLSIDDLRTFDEPMKKIDEKMLQSILMAVDEINKKNIKIKNISIDGSLIGDFRIKTLDGFDILLNNDVNIVEQIKILKILLDEKGDSFNPEYIDLKIDGRIYYK